MGIIARLGGRGARKTGSRMYAAAKHSRLTAGWGQSNTSADSELSSSLRTLRQRSRALVRDAAYAKRAKVIVVNNVVGAGIGMQAQVMTSRNQLNERINGDIEQAWEYWSYATNCHTGGALCFSDFERAVMGQVFEAGEAFIRKYYRPFGDSEIPFALELIEAERIADEFQLGPIAQNARVRLGIETDSFHRPVAYWIRQLHPGEIRLTAEETDRLERVPADQIVHMRLVDRWPQTRGEPWLHAVARKLNDMDGYSEAEIIAARGAASYMAVIETEGETDFAEEKQDGTSEVQIEPGIVERLRVGEKFNFVTPNRPNASMEPFMRFMLREMAAGANVSYESLSRDYSQSNYSSSRLALLDDRDLWRMLQMWFIRALREPLHREWLQQAVLSRQVSPIGIEEYANNPRKFAAVRFKPRGWSWIDPTKEVQAYKEAVRCGFTTVSDVIAITGSGRDVEDVLKERRRELDLMEQNNLEFDTDPNRDSSGKVPSAPPETPSNNDETQAEAASRVALAVGQAVGDAVRQIKPPQALVTVERTVVNVPPSQIRVESPTVTVHPGQVNIDNHLPPAKVEVAAPEVRIENHVPVPSVDIKPADVHVNVAAPEVKIENNVETPAPVVNVAPAEVRVENNVETPVVQVSPAEVRIDNRVEVPSVKRTRQTVEYGDNGKVAVIETVAVR